VVQAPGVLVGDVCFDKTGSVSPRRVLLLNPGAAGEWDSL
jgi:hypothetical protein